MLYLPSRPFCALLWSAGGLPSLLTSDTAIVIYIFVILSILAALVVAVLMG